jgi:hypothetical protein
MLREETFDGEVRLTTSGLPGCSDRRLDVGPGRAIVGCWRLSVGALGHAKVRES